MSEVLESCAVSERRAGKDRRMVLDKRNSVRFDKSGGDRRAGSGRRMSDESLEVLEY
jgi:hypothetical protein